MLEAEFCDPMTKAIARLGPYKNQLKLEPNLGNIQPFYQ